MRLVAKLIIPTAFFLFISCSSGSDTFQVNWENYSPEVKENIELLILNKNCSGLQEQFNIAEENSESQRSRTGKGNLELMQFLANAISKIGC